MCQRSHITKESCKSFRRFNDAVNETERNRDKGKISVSGGFSRGRKKPGSNYQVVRRMENELSSKLRQSGRGVEFRERLPYTQINRVSAYNVY